MKIVLIVASIETTYHRLKSVFDRVMGGLLGALGMKLLADAGRSI